MISGRFEGGDRLAINLDRVRTNASRKMMRDSLREGAQPMRDRVAAAVRRAPGSPDLADHIVVGTSKPRGEDVAAISVGPSKEERTDQPGRRFDEQAYYLEFGTLYRAATPFMRQGMSATGQALDTMKEPVWDGITKGVSE